MSKIDLHGVKHEDVQKVLDTFFWQSMQKDLSQVEVITGISDKMKTIVKEVSKEYGFEVNEKYFNPGILVVNLS